MDSQIAELDAGNNEPFIGRRLIIILMKVVECQRSRINLQNSLAESCQDIIYMHYGRHIWGRYFPVIKHAFQSTEGTHSMNHATHNVATWRLSGSDV